MLQTRFGPADPARPRWHVAVVGSSDAVDNVFHHPHGIALRGRRLTSPLRTYDLSRRGAELAGGALVDDVPVLDAVLLAVRPQSLAVPAAAQRALSAAAFFGVPVVVAVGLGGPARAEACARAAVEGAGGDGNDAVVVRGVDDASVAAALDGLPDRRDRSADAFEAVVRLAYNSVTVVVGGGSVGVGDRVVVAGTDVGGVVSAVSIDGAAGVARAGDVARVVIDGVRPLQLSAGNVLVKHQEASMTAPTTTLSLRLKALERLPLPWPASSGWGFGARGRVVEGVSVDGGPVGGAVLSAGGVVDVDVVVPERVWARPGLPVWVSHGVGVRAVGRVR